MTIVEERSRPTELERLFGDPWNATNPLGFIGIGEADERAELLAAGEALLDRWRFNAELVPVRLGGRMAGADELVRRLRPVFRRDVSLGLGYGITSLMAAVNVWAAGSDTQQRRISRLLLDGAHVAVAYHEPDHGNDLARNDFRAAADGERFRLSGAKQLINNIERAPAFVLFARTDDSAGARGHSLLLIHKDEIEDGALNYLPHTSTSAVRGVNLSGFACDGCAVPASALLGERGTGMEIALRSFQVTRAVLPGLAVGTADTALRVVYRFAATRGLYGTTVGRLPYARDVLAGAFVDVLTADALSTVATRALHLAPRQSSPYAAAVKYLVPRLLSDVMEDLAVVLGARFYLREGDLSIFGKHLRDMPVLGLGHGGETACLLAIIPQLVGLARNAWRPGPEPDEQLFDPTSDLPELDYSPLSVAASGHDPLTSSLLTAREWPQVAEAADPTLNRLLTELHSELDRLIEQCRAIRPIHRGPLADPETFGHAETYTCLLAAAACLCVWKRARTRRDPFLGDTGWITAALDRLAARARVHRREPSDLSRVGGLMTELDTRISQGASLDLSRVPVFV